ncbi:DUF6221 family protein [Arthrobacter sp. MDT1-65]
MASGNQNCSSGAKAVTKAPAARQGYEPDVAAAVIERHNPRRRGHARSTDWLSILYRSCHLAGWCSSSSVAWPLSSQYRRSVSRVLARPDDDEAAITAGDYPGEWMVEQQRASCRSRRELVAHVQRIDWDYEPAGDADYMRTILEIIAEPYAGHPDFRPEWKTA